MVRTYSLGQNRFLTPVAFVCLSLALLGSWLLVELNLLGGSEAIRVLLLLVSLVFLVVAAAPMLRTSVASRGDFFDVRSLYLIAFSVFSLAFPVGCVFDPQGAEDLLRSERVAPWPLSTILTALLLCFIGLLGYRVGAALTWGRKLAQRLPVLPPKWDTGKAYGILYAYLITGIVLYSIFIYQVAGGFRAYLRVSAGGTAESYLLDQGEGHLKVGWVMIQLALIVLYCVTHNNPQTSRVHRYVVYGMCSIFLVLSVAVGRRSHVVILLLSVLAARHVLVRRISARAMTVVLVVGLLALNSFSFFRGALGMGLDEAYYKVHDQFTPSWFALNNNFFGSPYIFGLTDTVDAVPKKMDYWYGRSYFRAVEALIPKVVVRERELTAVEWYTSTFHPSAYSRGGGMGFFVVAEAYLNFGVLGVFSVLFVTGVLLSALYHYLLSHNKNFSAIVFYCAVLPIILVTIGDGFAAITKYLFLYTCCPLVLFSYLAAKVKPRILRNSRTAFRSEQLRDSG
jgi:oligosaccharide repeat unit polymerase